MELLHFCSFVAIATLLLLLLLFVALEGGFAVGAEQLSQFGITWTFDANYVTGQFANGDFWAVGPVTITAIDPPSREVDGRVSHGTMINPLPSETQGFDSHAYAKYRKASSYDASRNVAYNVEPNAPLRVPAGRSLLSSISMDDPDSRPSLRAAAVLTVLATVPPAGSFRPAYCGTDKTVRWNVAQLNYQVLKRLAAVPGTPTWATVERWFERPWPDGYIGWTGRYLHPAENMPDYGYYIAARIADGALMLCLDVPEEQKETLAIRMVQLGIDLRGIAAAGGYWPDEGGHGSGRKLAILLAGLLLGDDHFADAGKMTTFAADAQTWYVGPADVGRVMYRGDGKQRQTYEPNDVGMPEWGEMHTRNSARDDRRWEASYRETVGRPMASQVLAARLLGLREQWGHEALFAYADRWVANEQARNWPIAVGTFAKQMWLAYRHTPAVGDCWDYARQAEGDYNGDGVITSADAVGLNAAWVAQYRGEYDRCADFNHDGIISPADARILMAHWGKGE